MKKKLSILIAICMIVTMLPAATFAATGGATIVGGVTYASFNEALWAAKDGDTIRLNEDIMGPIYIQNKNITIDGNNKKFVGNSQREILSILGASVRIHNLDVVSVNTAMDICGSAIVTLENCDFFWASEQARSVVCYDKAAVTIKNCTFSDTLIKGSGGFEMTCVEASEGAHVDVIDCKMEFGSGTGVVALHNGYIKCSGCVIMAENGYAAQADPKGKLYLEDVFFKGMPALFMNKDSKATIKSGWFESTYDMAGAINGAKTNVTIEKGSKANPANWRNTVSDRVIFGVNIAKPQNLKVNLSGQYNTIKASWGRASSADGYAVYYKKGTGAYKLWTRTTGTAVTIKNLAAGANYTVKVVPYQNFKGPNGTVKNETSNVATKAVYTLKKVTLKQFGKKNGKVNVKWNNINGESGYQISRTLKKNATNVFATVVGSNVSNKLIQAPKGKKYFYKVRAYKTVNGKKVVGPWSAPKQYTR